MKRPGLERLEDLPNVGGAIADKLRTIGVEQPADLVGRDPYELFDQFARQSVARPDPCLLDVFISVTRFMSGESPRPWWAYTSERKARLRHP